jgi:carbon monoxide dehydrogenase subunit G
VKVALDKSIVVPGPPEVAWELLQDVEAVAACMPGAKLTERAPEGGYKGTVTVKFGPATLAFRGKLEVRDVDAASRSLRLVGSGTDTTGTSGASMDLAARIDRVDDASSTLVGKSDVDLSGKAAAFGGRMMSSVADVLLKQFGDNFAREVATRAAQRPAPAVPAAATAAPAGVADAPPALPAPGTARELDGLALLWSLLRNWLRGLFGSRST